MGEILLNFSADTAQWMYSPGNPGDKPPRVVPVIPSPWHLRNRSSVPDHRWQHRGFLHHPKMHRWAQQFAGKKLIPAGEWFVFWRIYVNLCCLNKAVAASWLLEFLSTYQLRERERGEKKTSGETGRWWLCPRVVFAVIPGSLILRTICKEVDAQATTLTSPPVSAEPKVSGICVGTHAELPLYHHPSYLSPLAYSLGSIRGYRTRKGQPSAMAIDGARMLFWMTITCRNLLHLDCPGKKIKGRIWWWLVLFLISADVQCWILGIERCEVNGTRCFTVFAL